MPHPAVNRTTTGLALAALLCTGGAALAGPRVPRPHIFHPRAPRAPRMLGLPGSGLAGGALVQQAQSDPNAEGLLRQMLMAENRLALSGTQVTMVSGGARSEQRVLRDGARALRLDYLTPPQMRGEEIIDDGKTYFHYLPEQHRWEAQPSQVHSLRVRVPQVLKQIREGQILVQWVGQDTVAGHSCGVVDVTARGATPGTRRRFWIDPTNGAQLKIEEYNAQGQLQSVSYYTSVTYNPPLNAQSFAPPQASAAPAAPTKTQPTPPTPAQVGFTVLLPTYLPPGFHWQSAAVTEYGGQKVAGLRYTNGLSLLSLYETLDNGRGPATRLAHPGVLVARRKGLKIVLVSSLGRGVLESVVNSLR